jgi:ABC-type transport system involved in Fe-S cluster assembly fused permease/ATPase subunit
LASPLLIIFSLFLSPRACLVITHRLVGLDWMDEILGMQDGRVVVRGRQEELLKQEGVFKRIWDLQNRGVA